MSELIRIGKVAKIYDISLDTLRLYEKKELLIPYRSRENQYRYYTVEQLDTLELILNSKKAGMSLKDIYDMLYSADVLLHQKMFQKQLNHIEKQIRNLKRAKSYTEKKIKDLNKTLELQNQKFSQKDQVSKEEETIYIIELDFLLRIGFDSSEIEGMELLETWKIFETTNEQEVKENTKIAGFSFQKSDKVSPLEQEFIKLQKIGEADIVKIPKNKKQISFVGNSLELINYMEEIKQKPPIIYVKNIYGTVNPIGLNEYFTTIYL